MNTALEDKLRHYEALLKKWQKAVNLVSPKTLDRIWERHIDDSLQVAEQVPEAARTLFDFGSGAGFPGLVIAMVRPALEVYLIESDHKKCSFMGAVSRETQTPAHIHAARIEALELDAVPDVITARALAPLRVLLDLCRPYADANPDLCLIFPKGRHAEQEIEEARLFFDFDVRAIPSRTEPEASILVVTHLCIKPH